MLRSPLVAGLARRQRRADALLVAIQPAADEDRLTLLHVRQLHPRELVAAAREVEEPLPVAAREADDALRPQHVARQPVEEARERVLIERARRAEDEAADAVAV